MQTEVTKEWLMNAEIAFSNQQYSVALTWYKKVLDQTPNDIYVLSRTGAICVPLGLFEDALKYFGKAKELDPENGDNHFNYANACFFNKDVVNAFSSYVEAEQKGCSEDVTPRLYYQMAMLCSMREDIASALVYFKKCEMADKSGTIALNPDMIAEKLKLYTMLKDYPNAEACAAQLVAIQPTEFKYHMVYYTILSAHNKLRAAEKLLQGTERFAEMTDDDRFNLALQKAALLMAKGEQEDSRYYEEAISLLKGYANSTSLTDEQTYQTVIMLSEIYLKIESYDNAIHCLVPLITEKEADQDQPLAEVPCDFDWGEDDELSPEEINEMIREDWELIQDAIDRGELDRDYRRGAEIEYDEDGNEVLVYNDDMFAFLDSAEDTADSDDDEQTSQKAKELSPEIRDKIYFTLLSAFLGKEDFVGAAKIAQVLKHSENTYYSYFGLYSVALSERKMNGNTPEVERTYAEAIAFFRNKTFENSSDSLASVFRARLYVEQGKFVKAKEIALLLSDSDRQSILDYMEQCK